MPVCTSSDVFQFVGAPQDVQTTQASAVTALIINAVSEVEQIIGRRIESYAVNNLLLQHDVNCTVFGNKIYLGGAYHDIYSISSLTLNGTALTAVSSTNATGDYYLDTRHGIIVRNGQHWGDFGVNLVLTGSAGLNGGVVPPAIKQAVIEMVAVKTGLWKHNVMTEGGRIESIRTTTNRDTMELLDRYRLRGIYG